MAVPVPRRLTEAAGPHHRREHLTHWLISTQVRAAELFLSEGSREEEARTAALARSRGLRPERPRGAADPGLLSRAVRVREKSQLAIDATLCDAGKYTKRLKNLAAEAKKRAHDEKLAAVWKSISGSRGSVDDGAVKF